MLKYEIITIDGRDYDHHFSDAGMKIRQLATGAIYDDAIDPLNSGREYEETDIPIEPAPEPEDTTNNTDEPFEG